MSTDSSARGTTIRTLRGEITLDEALEEEQDMLRRLTYWDKRIYFLDYLLDHSVDIEAVVSYHLDLKGKGSCYLAPLDDWIHGSFNMCLPVYVRDRKTRPEKRVMIRFPLPYKIGEDASPGNAEEKLRCEAATYIWIREHCPDVPIPQLWGFAFHGNHQTVDNLTGERLTEYDRVREEFMEAFEHEEKLQRNGWKLQGDNDDLPRTQSTTGLFNLWGRTIQPRFSNVGNLEDETNRLLAPHWCMNAESVIAAKIKDREAYNEQLGAMFEAKSQASTS
ncbi:MAG: hypothetical protein Q9196_002998 [Gyalolechia fulgens]